MSVHAFKEMDRSKLEDEHLDACLKIADLQHKLQIARYALDEALSYRLHYKNDDGSEPDIFDEDSWSDVGARELTDILVDVLKTVKRARKALEEINK